MIRLVGKKAIDEIIRRLPSQLDHKLLQSIHAEQLKPYLKAAYYAAPLDSGRTAKSIGVVKPNIKRATSIGLVVAGPRRGRFGGNVAHFTETGTAQRKNKSGANKGKVKANPYLAPSWARTSGQVLAGYREATGKVLYSFMKRTVKKYGN